MKTAILAILFLFASVTLASPTVLIDEPWAEVDFASLFSPENQALYVQDRTISFGPYTYSVDVEYSASDRQRIWVESHKWLAGKDTETLLYVYQYVIAPIYIFPLADYPLYEKPAPAIGAPESSVLVGIALCFISLKARRRWN